MPTLLRSLLLAVLLSVRLAGAAAPPEPTGIESSPEFRVMRNEEIADFEFKDADIADIMRALAKLFGREAVVADDAHAKVTLPKSPAPFTVSQAWEKAVEAARAQGLEVQGDTKHVYVFRKGAKRPVAPKPSQAPGKKLPKNGSTVNLSKEAVRKSLEGLPLEKQARIVPYFEGDKPQGSTVLLIEPGSVYELMGIENGDVICAINQETPLAPTLHALLEHELERVVQGGSLRVCLKRQKTRSVFTLRAR